MEFFAAYNAYTQQNTLNELQLSNLNGFIQSSPLINILFIVFLIMIIAYFIWTRKQ